MIDPEIDVHCPVLEMTSRAKLSSVCWSSYIKQHLASSDYEGTGPYSDEKVGTANRDVRGFGWAMRSRGRFCVAGTVTLWDASTSTPLIDFEEHRKRAWTVRLPLTRL